MTASKRAHVPVRGVVIAHADLAEALVTAVARIAGESDALVPLSNEARGPREMREAVEAACAGAPSILFTDLASGSCALAGRLAAAHDRQVAVITGANLPMLLDFVFHRELELEELVERLVRKGRDGISGEPDDSPAARGRGADRPASD